MTRVFVYGTLRPDLYPMVPHRFGVRALGPASIATNRQMVNMGAFPALVPSDEPQVIRGELIEADSEAMADLDRYEGYRLNGSGLYDRVLIQAISDGELVPAFVYVMHQNKRNAAPVPSNDWADVVEARREHV